MTELTRTDSSQVRFHAENRLYDDKFWDAILNDIRDKIPPIIFKSSMIRNKIITEVSNIMGNIRPCLNEPINLEEIKDTVIYIVNAQEWKHI